MDDQAILRWIGVKLKEDKIKSVTRNVLDKLIEKFPHIGVVFVDDENKSELEIINQLEAGINVIREEELVVVQVGRRAFVGRGGDVKDFLFLRLIHTSCALACAAAAEGCMQRNRNFPVSAVAKQPSATAACIKCTSCESAFDNNRNLC